MPDNVLSFETRVNLSGLESGTAQAKSTISQFSATAKQAMETAAQATANLASAQRELASVVAAGGVEGAKAAAVIAEYAQEARQAQAAAADYAKENITAASAVRTLSSAEAEETGVLQRSMSTRMAASTELRELSGNLTGSTRAAGAFLASLPGIGAAMQAAFPIFGAVAVLEILGQLAGKVHAVYDEWVNLRSIQNDVIKSVLEDEEQEIRLSEQRVAQLREERGLQAELRGDKAGRSDRGAAAKARFDVNIDQNSLELAKANLAAVNQQLDQLRTKSKETTDIPIMGELGSAKTLTDDARRAAAEIPKLTEKLQSYGDEITTLSQKLQVAHDQETLRNKESGEREAVAGAAAIKKANAALYESMENDYNRSRAAGNATLASEYEFWSARLQLFDSSTEQYKAIFEKVAAIAEANARRVHTAIELLKVGDNVAAFDSLTGTKKTVTDEGPTDVLKGQAAALTMVKEAAQKAAEQLAKVNAENQHIKAAGALQIQETKIQAGSSLGLTDPLKDLEQLRALHQQAIAEDERYIQQQIAADERAAQQEIQIHQNEADKVREIQSRLDQELLQLNKQLQTDQQKGQQQQLNDTVKILQQQEQKYRQVYETITNDFNSAISKMITTTEKPAQVFAQMLNQMLSQLATFVLQYIEKKAEMWVLDQLLGKAAATSSALTQISTDAAVAGAGAYAATAVIPVVGPELAPAAAASAYAATLSFLGLAAFEQGGVVSGGHGLPVPIMAHAGERVLSAPQTQNFERMVNGGGGAGHTTHINYNPHVSAFDNSGLKSTLNSHKETILDIVRQGYKQGSLVR